MVKGYDRDNYAERALAFLEKDICYLSQMNWGYGIDKEDVAQELRLQIWRKLHLYHPGKAGLRTWGQRVMRMRLIDMKRGMINQRKGYVRDMLNMPDRRVHPESEEVLYLLTHEDRRVLQKEGSE